MTPDLWDALRIGMGFCFGVIVGFSIATVFIMAGRDGNE